MKKLYLGNLPFAAVEEKLQEWFVAAGVTPSAVNLVRDRLTGQSRGFAFVEFSNDQDADRAVTVLNGHDFGGRKLVVNEAHPQAERPSGGPQGRAGGGRNSPGAGGRTGRADRGRSRDNDDSRGNR